MISSKRMFVLVSLLTGALMSANLSAAPVGKIYLGGRWVDAELPSGPKAFSPLFIPLQLTPSLEENKKTVRNFLESNSLLLSGFSTVSWQESSVQSGAELETHRVKKTWNGLEVLGGEALVHLQKGEVVFANADNTSLSHLSTSARLHSDDAARIAFSSYRGGGALRAETPALKVILLGQNDAREARLVYSVKVVDIDALSSDVHFIDAQSGQEVLVTSNVHTASRKVMAGTGTRDDMAIVTNSDGEQQMNEKFKLIYSDKGCENLSGFSFFENWKKRSEDTTAASRECNVMGPEIMSSALSAWNNSGKVFSYFQSAHRWDSINGRGAEVRSIVNFGGAAFQNAAWYNDRRIMLYGMGDGLRFNDFASSLDIVAHEITHGLIMSTAQLVYAGESGALNESYADVFGKLVAFRAGARNEWKLGRDLFRDGTSFIRDMENPDVAHNRDYKFRDQLCHRFNDFCGVHENSGIPNKAAVLIAKRIGLEKLGRLYFLTLSQLLRSSSDFREARAQTEAACATLFRQGSSDCQAVSEAFSAVGI